MSVVGRDPGEQDHHQPGHAKRHQSRRQSPRDGCNRNGWPGPIETMWPVHFSASPAVFRNIGGVDKA